MGKIVHRNQPCLDTIKCGSSDARQVYEDGGSHCFSCGKDFPKQKFEDFEEQKDSYKNNNKMTLDEVKSLDIRGFRERGIKKEACEHYKVRVEYDSTKNIIAHYYPYGAKDVVGYKIRHLPKTFSSVGKISGLFGQFLFNSGKRLVITEGEIDALTIAQAYLDRHGQVYPVVSISGATNTKELLVQ
jgi:twinkle protein